MSFPIYDIIRINMPSPNSHGFRNVYTLPCDALVFGRITGGGRPDLRVVGQGNTYGSCGWASTSPKFFWAYAPQGSEIQRSEGSGGGTGNCEVVIYLISPYSKAQTVSTNGATVTG
jgi:hypothetical protein